MGNFTAAKAGGWAFREPLYSPQISHLQEQLLKAPNFTEGSTHSLTGDLTVGTSNASKMILNLLGILGAGPTHFWTLGGFLNFDRTSSAGRILLSTSSLTLSGAGSIAPTAAAITVYTSLNGAPRSTTLAVTSDLKQGDWKIVANADATYELTVYEPGGAGVLVVPHGFMLAVSLNGTGWSLFG